jgi:hypothetical protein
MSSTLDPTTELEKAKRENETLRRQLQERGAFGELVGTSEPIRKIYTLIEQVAPSSASVLITGESGTGKELVARTIHRMSPRRDRPFVAINCSAIPETLMESELFGHEKGAFTGAASRRQGCFELADTGTTRSVKCPHCCKQNSCASSKNAPCAASVVAKKSLLTCDSSPPPIAIHIKLSRKANCAMICFIV